MKKRICLRLCLLLLTVAVTAACSGCGLLSAITYQVNTDAESVILSEEPTPQDAPTSTDDTPATTQPSVSATSPVFLREKYEAEIEADRDADAELPEYQSTAGMCELSDQYTKRWMDIADKYYNKLLAYEHEEDVNSSFCSVEEFRTALADMKAAHEDHVEKEMTAYSTILRYEYQGGTISGVIAAGHRYNLEKEWALKILDICDMLGVE